MWLRTWGVVLLLSATTFTLILLSACGGAPPQATPDPGHADEHSGAQVGPIPLAPGEKLRVVATTNIVGDVVSQVGGDRIELTTLMDVGLDPHSYVPSPSDSAALHDAHLILANGAGLETGLEEMLTNAGGDALEVSLSDRLTLRQLEAGTPGQTTEEEHDHSGVDPHVWLDVSNVIQWVQTIQETLSTMDPANAAYYAANAQPYTQELEALDAWAEEQIARIPETNRKLVTNHPAFGYLAARYGLEQVGAVYPISPSSEPSAQDIAALEDTIRSYNVPAVFAESTVNNRLAEQVANDTDIKLVPLYSGSLGAAGTGAETYILMIRYDVTAIVEALQ
jgi:manganese/iron transport system substrate-binding protein